MFSRILAQHPYYTTDFYNEDDKYQEFLLYYLPSINESEISDFEFVLLAIRQRQYAVTRTVLSNILAPILVKRQQQSIYQQLFLQSWFDSYEYNQSPPMAYRLLSNYGIE